MRDPRIDPRQTDLAELRRLHEAATKGQWVAMTAEYEAEDGIAWEQSADCQRDADHAEYISAAHNALPALLDELEAARLEMRRQASVIAEYKGEVERLVDCIFQGEGIDGAGELGITRENFREWLRAEAESIEKGADHA